MTNAVIASDTTPAAATWRRVNELADLVYIFDPAVQVCVWRRTIDPAVTTYLDGLAATNRRQQQMLERMAVGDEARISSLPAGSGRESLIADITLLREILGELLGCPIVGLRLARIGHAMCPGWHVDRVAIRLVCTYQGSGTEWLDDQDVDRADLSVDRLHDSAAIRAEAGEVVLLKGALWQNNARFGAMHRSPELAVGTALRTLVTLDPIWHS